MNLSSLWILLYSFIRFFQVSLLCKIFDTLPFVWINYLFVYLSFFGCSYLERATAVLGNTWLVAQKRQLSLHPLRQEKIAESLEFLIALMHIKIHWNWNLFLSQTSKKESFPILSHSLSWTNFLPASSQASFEAVTLNERIVGTLSF